MQMRWYRILALAVVICVAPAWAGGQDVPFLESPESVVEAMLELGEVTDDDIVYDLGSGDGRIVIAAAATRGARGVGIEIESELIVLSNDNAHAAGVADRVRFVQEDLFEADFSEATVVMIYLYPKVNRRLRPVLTEQLAPGTRVVSHRFEIQGWRPVQRIKVEGRPVFLYVVPPTSPFATGS
jgi:SAM-dependent methyltransferase